MQNRIKCECNAGLDRNKFWINRNLIITEKNLVNLNLVTEHRTPRTLIG